MSPEQRAHVERRRRDSVEYARSVGADTPEKVRLLFGYATPDIVDPFYSWGINPGEIELIIEMMGLSDKSDRGIEDA